MVIKVNSNNKSFIYDCSVFPRIGESIIYEDNCYMVRSVYYHVWNNKANIEMNNKANIEVDVEYRCIYK
jgi:hypothetical protein